MTDTLVVDFETYYATDFSLTKLQTDAYVLDSRYETIGVAVKRNDEPTVWFTGSEDETNAFLRTFDFMNSIVVCHNTLFDGFILSQRFGISPRLWSDTLGMAKAIHPYRTRFSLASLATDLLGAEKGTEVLNAVGKRRADFTDAEMRAYAEYCKLDVELTYRLYHLFIDEFPLVEQKIMDMVIRMFTEPTLVGDVPMLRDLYATELARKEALLALAEIDRDVIMSNDKLAAALIELGVSPPTKTSMRTGKQSYAFAKTDQAFTDLLEHPMSEVQNLVGARLGVKTTIAETRALKMLETAQRGPLPVYLNYWGAKTTGRLSGGNKINFQNLPARGISAGIRKAICAPEGAKLVVGDSSNIELRVAMVCAGEDDAVEMLRNGQDLYCDFATAVYGRNITKADVKERLMGKIAMLSLQYGAGYMKFVEMVRLQAGITISEQEAKDIVYKYRGKYARIVALWEHCNNEVLPNIANGEGLLAVDKNAWAITTPVGIAVPGHPGIYYKNLQKDSMTGDWSYMMSGKPVKIYGGKVVENLCIDGDALVLTAHGWKPLKTVGAEKVHDGVEFVTHGGKVLKGIKQCVTIDGVAMTPDHEVLTNEGWKAALEKPRPYRPDLRHVEGATPFPQRREENALGVSVPVWGASGEDRSRCNQRDKAGRDTKLRMQNQAPYFRGEQKPWHERTPSVLGMEKYAGQMQTTYASSVGKLRRAWDYSMHRVGGFVRELLGGHGAWVCDWTYARPDRQRAGVCEEQLQVGAVQGELFEQEEQHRPRLESDIRCYRDTTVDALLPTCTREVFDIMDCGPRNRFVVLGEAGPFIVHNCQYVARNIVLWQTAKYSQKYPVAMSVHDEIVSVIPDSDVEESEAYMLKCLQSSPKWCKGLIPLTGEVGIGSNYAEAK